MSAFVELKCEGLLAGALTATTNDLAEDAAAFPAKRAPQFTDCCEPLP